MTRAIISARRIRNLSVMEALRWLRPSSPHQQLLLAVTRWRGYPVVAGITKRNFNWYMRAKDRHQRRLMADFVAEVADERGLICRLSALEQHHALDRRGLR